METLPMRRLTIIESPFAATMHRTQDDHILYLRECLRHSWSLGELPFASHGFFPLFLHESDPEERKAGIEAGFQFWDFCLDDDAATPWPLIAFYCDLGISRGMKAALERVKQSGNDFVIRNIHPTFINPEDDEYRLRTDKDA
jgi:hypothetical protein